MSLTAIGQIRELLVPAVVSDDRCWRRSDLPDDAEMPFLTLSEISTTPRLQGDSSTIMSVTELVQVDVWQSVWFVDLTLLDRTIAALNSKKLNGDHLRVTVQDAARVPEEGVVHDAITVRVARLIPSAVAI